MGDWVIRGLGDWDICQSGNPERQKHSPLRHRDSEKCRSKNELTGIKGMKGIKANAEAKSNYELRILNY